MPGRNLIGICMAIVAAAAVATGQVTVIEEKVTTDSIDLFTTPPVDSTRSAALAMIGNLVLPGLGHQYLRKPRRALTYYSVDLACLFGAIGFERYARRLMDDSRTMAWMYAGARGGPGADNTYWQALGAYLDSDGYNHVQELNRTPEDKYADPGLQWAWIDTSYMKEYNRTRDDATSYHIASTFFIGAMVLNRVVAFIDARVTMIRKSSSQRLSSIRFQPVAGPDGASGLNLSGEF